MNDKTNDSGRREKFDYGGYEKSLEVILNAAFKDYWTQYVDVNRHQVGVAKTYLWVAAAMLGAYAACYNYFELPLDTISIYLVVLPALAVLLAIFAFGLCLYSIPARHGYKTIAMPSWGVFAERAYSLLKEKEEHLNTAFLTDFIYHVDVAASHNLKTNQKRAKHLRATSWLLIGSFCFALLTPITFYTIIDYTTNKETVMTEENKPTSSGSDAENVPATDVPNVPVPHGPIGGNLGDITTHSEESPVSIRITEASEHKTEK